MRVMVFGDSNSWGTPPDGSDLRFDESTRWPCIMANQLGAVLIEEALPGRTTAHDDPEMLGPVMNGLKHLPVALRSNSPLDLVVIMLGTNDFKARFKPTGAGIAANIARLVECVREVGGGVGPWGDINVPSIAIIVPPSLPAIVDNANWDRAAEWHGGRAASLALAGEMADLAKVISVALFDADKLVAGSSEDPIHLDSESHNTLGTAIAHWLQSLPESA